MTPLRSTDGHRCYPLVLLLLCVMLCAVNSLLVHSLATRAQSHRRWTQQRNSTCDPGSYRHVCCFCNPNEIGHLCCVDRGSRGYSLYCLDAECVLWTPTTVLWLALAIVGFAAQVVSCAALALWLRSRCPGWTCRLQLVRLSGRATAADLPTDVDRGLRQADADACTSQVYAEYMRRQRGLQPSSWRFESIDNGGPKPLASVSAAVCTSDTHKHHCLNQYIDAANRFCYV